MNSTECRLCEHFAGTYYFCQKHYTLIKAEAKPENCEHFKRIGTVVNSDECEEQISIQNIADEIEEFQYIASIIRQFRENSKKGKAELRHYLIVLVFFHRYIENINYQFEIEQMIESDEIISKFGNGAEEILKVLNQNASIVDILDQVLPVTKRAIYNDLENVEEKLKKISQNRRRQASMELKGYGKGIKHDRRG